MQQNNLDKSSERANLILIIGISATIGDLFGTGII